MACSIFLNGDNVYNHQYMGSPKPLRLSEYKSTIKALNIFILYTFKLIKLVSFETQNDIIYQFLVKMMIKD